MIMMVYQFYQKDESGSGVFSWSLVPREYDQKAASLVICEANGAPHSVFVLLLKMLGELLLLLEPLLPRFLRLGALLVLIGPVPHGLDRLVVQIEAKHDTRVKGLFGLEG